MRQPSAVNPDGGYHPSVRGFCSLWHSSMTVCHVSASFLIRECRPGAHSTMSNTSLLYVQDGTAEDDALTSAVLTADGNIVLSGRTLGDFDGEQVGFYDAVAVKLNADGEELWRYQVKHAALYESSCQSIFQWSKYSRDSCKLRPQLFQAR